jgi:hypothetical protein
VRHGLGLGERDAGDFLGHDAGDGAGEAGQHQMEADRVRGQRQGIIEIAIVDRPKHIGDEDFVLGGLALLARLQAPSIQASKALANSAFGDAGLVAGDVLQRAQVVVEQHAQGGIFLAFGRAGVRLGGAVLSTDGAAPARMACTRCLWRRKGLLMGLGPVAGGPQGRVASLRCAGSGCRRPRQVPIEALGYYGRSPKVMFSAITA